MSTDLHSDKGTPGGFVCLVSGEGDYDLSEEKTTELIRRVDPNNTQDYSIVGIMGCQSTGKSTLLNRLFNTQFSMMDQTVRRGQTTKGIWLDAARNTNNLVIMDLEGTDSGERGEDRTTFERQTILYALALCEILIVNMWETDIGRYTASNYGIMKTVFEVNMQLFKSRGKTQLLFIIRDYNEQGTPFVTLRDRLLREIESIWSELSKPDEFKDTTMFDFFDFKFTYLPHYVYCRDKFESMALELQRKFTDKNHPDSYLATPYHGSKSVPAESFAIYAHNIWNTIKDNQDLNLPTQKEMLATFRCDEMVSSIITQYVKDIQPLREEATKRLTLTLGTQFNELISQAITQYNTACKRYSEQVVNRKKDELITKLLDLAQDVVFTNLKLFLTNDLIAKFDVEINDGVTPNEVFIGIMERCKDVKTKYIQTFKTKSNELIQDLYNNPELSGCQLTDDVVVEEKEKEEDKEEETQHGGNIMLSTSMKRHENDFIEKLDALINNLRKQQLHALSSTAYTDFVERSEHLFNEQLKNAGVKMWENLGTIFNMNFHLGLVMVKKELTTLARTEDEQSFVKRRFYCDVETYLYSLIRAQLPQLPTKMRDRFEQLFIYEGEESTTDGTITYNTPDGLQAQRIWKGTDNANYLYDKAKTSSINLLFRFQTFILRKFLDAEAKQLLLEIETLLNNNEQSQISDEETNAEGFVVLKRTNSITSGNNTNTNNNNDDKQIQQQQQMLIPVLDLTLLTKEQLMDMERDLERKTQVHLTQAIVEVERARTNTGLPPWVWAVILILGYDEIMWALSNPFMLFFLIMIGIGVFVLYKLNMLGPVLTIAQAVGERLLTELTTAINPPPQQQQQQNQNITHANTNLGVAPVELVNSASQVNHNAAVFDRSSSIVQDSLFADDNGNNNNASVSDAMIIPSQQQQKPASTTLNLNMSQLASGNGINLDMIPPSPVNNNNNNNNNNTANAISPTNVNNNNNNDALLEKQQALLRRRQTAMTTMKRGQMATLKAQADAMYGGAPQ